MSAFQNKEFLAIFDRLPLGVIFVDTSLQVSASNRYGREFLEVTEGEALGSCETFRHHPEGLEELRGVALGKKEGLIKFERLPPHRALEIVVIPLAGHSTIVLLVSDPEASLSYPRDILRKLYGLTRAEAELAALLANGYSLQDAQRRLGLQMETIRSRLKGVFAKTGTGRQAELVRLLLTSSATLHFASTSFW